MIHGSLRADAILPLLAESRLTGSYRLIAYHRRGYYDSSRAAAPVPVGEQAADVRAMLRQLGIPRAHVVRHSYGSVIAMHLARDAPDLVATLALLEPALIALVPSVPTFFGMLGSAEAA